MSEMSNCCKPGPVAGEKLVKAPLPLEIEASEGIRKGIEVLKGRLDHLNSFKAGALTTDQINETCAIVQNLLSARIALNNLY